MTGRFCLLVCGCLYVGMACADNEPSDRLMDAALADHFTRYFCVSRVPGLVKEIQEEYDDSRLRFISVPCRGTRCSVTNYSRGMDVLLQRARELSASQVLETCRSYGETVKAIEAQHDDELSALFPWYRSRD